MRKITVLAAVGVFVLAGVALASGTSTYAGTTSQAHGGTHFPIHIFVTNGKVTRFNYRANFSGHAGCMNFAGSATLFIGSIGISHGKFSKTVKVAANDHVAISGKFTSNKVKGSFDETFKPGGTSYTCSSGKVSYSATKE